MASALVLLFISQALADHVLAEPNSGDNSAQCECYLLSGPHSAYLQHYRFWDFRNVANDGANDFTQAPPPITAGQNQGMEDITSTYFNTSGWTQDWSIQTRVRDGDDPGEISQVESAQNIFFTRNTSNPTNGNGGSTYLTLRTNRLPDFQSTAEIDSTQNNVLHSSIRARVRILPNPPVTASRLAAGSTAIDDARGSSVALYPADAGAVFGFFTYQSDTQESDIEIRTSDPSNRIRYANQPIHTPQGDIIPGASTNFNMGPLGFDYTQWLEHRLDWFPNITRSYINDHLVLEKTLNVPQQPSTVIMNLWGNNGDWSGAMKVGGQVQVGIEWIEMVYNVSGDAQASKKRNVPMWDLLTHKQALSSKTDVSNCHVGCNVHGVKRVGSPEVAFRSTAAMLMARGGSAMGLVITTTLLMGLYLFMV